MVTLLTIGINPSFAQTVKENPIITAVPFLKLSADAYAGAMGDIGVATKKSEAHSSFSTGAKQHLTKKNSVSV
ncbi:MAG: hypothetical protein ACKVOM_10180 [Ferruginibacter sp.]